MDSDFKPRGQSVHSNGELVRRRIVIAFVIPHVKNPFMLELSAVEVQELVYSELQQNPVLEEVGQPRVQKPGDVAGTREVPGNSSCQTEEVILPDLILHKVGAHFVVTINDSAIPQLRISKHYGSLLTQADASPEVKDYIRDKTDAAKRFIESLEQRQKVLLAIGGAIVEFQRDFLENKSDHIMPMVLPRVAVLAGLGEAATSHLLSNKYIETPLGVFRLTRFFPDNHSRN